MPEPDITRFNSRQLIPHGLASMLPRLSLITKKVDKALDESQRDKTRPTQKMADFGNRLKEEDIPWSIQNTKATEEAHRGTVNELTRQFSHVRTPKRASQWGVSEIAYCEATGVPHIMRYDIRRLITLGGILNLFARGTIFRDRYGLRRYFLVHFLGLALCIGVVMLAFSDYELMSTDKIEKLVKTLNFMVPLVLGFYLVLSLQRWWILRVDAVGKICDCALDVSQQVASYLPDEPDVIVRVNRWAVASLELLVRAAREESDVSGMVASGQLTPFEAEALNDIALYARAMVMWAWISRIMNEAMVNCKGPEPYSNHLSTMIDCCVKARRGIQTIHTYLLTPVPFTYVHMITFLVNTTVVALTMKCSLVCVRSFHENPRNYQVITFEGFTFVTLPLLYFGLLSATYVIRDPFGDDMSDFPVSQYQAQYQNHLNAAVLGCECFPWEEWESLSGQPQSRENKEKAAAFAPANVPKIPDEEIDEDSAGVTEIAKKVSDAILGDVTIEATVHVKRALKGFNEELKLLEENVKENSESRASDMEQLLTMLETIRVAELEKKKAREESEKEIEELSIFDFGSG